MSQPHKKKFGSEFLCKTRYRNNLPLPPFAPKLLALPSSMDRYIKYQATGLADTSMNDLLLDHQLGMPIDLVEMGNYFNESGAHAQQQQQQTTSGGIVAGGGAGSATVTLDQRDNFLLNTLIVSQNGATAAVPAPASAAATTVQPANGSAEGAAAGTGGQQPMMMVSNGHTPGLQRTRLPAVSWLRRTEYISSETPHGAGKGAYKESASKLKKVQIDQSREGQIRAIDKTFDRFWNANTKEPLTEQELLSSLKHPLNKNVTAVETIPIFPDFMVWGNSYTLATFDFDPEEDRSRSNNRNRNKDDEEGGARGSSKKAQLASNALIKPMSSPNDMSDTWLAYYLPDSETARDITARKRVAGLALDGEEDGMDTSARTPPREGEESSSQPHQSTLPEGIKVRTFAHQRDCTYQTMPCSTLSQFVFTFREGDDGVQKRAFYDPIQSKLRLSKKHKRTHEMDYTVITHIDATFRRVYSTEQAAKKESLEASGLL